uniref:Secreted protein n=1 Tax=Rhipicephalus microplus TaxID=6941 RepID=A0A6G5A256_RHIMP
MNYIWVACSFVFTQAILANGEFQAVKVFDDSEGPGNLVRTLVKRSAATSANKRVRRGILGAAKMAKDVTTAAIRGVMSMKNTIRKLTGEDRDEPFDPIDVDAILKAEGYDDEPMLERDGEDAFAALSTDTARFLPTEFSPPISSYNEGPMKDMGTDVF